MAKYGIIYVIQNDMHPKNIFKVGYTTNSIQDRITELNRETSNPGKFKVCGYFPVTNVDEAENLCHQRLSHLGFEKKKEFFEGSINRIFSVVEGVCVAFKPKSYISKEYMDGEIHTDDNSSPNPKKSIVKCQACHGLGEIRKNSGFFTIAQTCEQCEGTGKVWS